MIEMWNGLCPESSEHIIRSAYNPNVQLSIKAKLDGDFQKIEDLSFWQTKYGSARNRFFCLNGSFAPWMILVIMRITKLESKVLMRKLFGVILSRCFGNAPSFLAAC